MSCLEPQFDYICLHHWNSSIVHKLSPIWRWKWHNGPLSVCSHHSATLKWAVVSTDGYGPYYVWQQLILCENRLNFINIAAGRRTK